MTHTLNFKLKLALHPGIHSLGLLLFLSACDQQGGTTTQAQGDGMVYQDAVEQFKLTQEAADAEARRKAAEAVDIRANNEAERKAETEKLAMQLESSNYQAELAAETQRLQAAANDDFRNAQTQSNVDVARINAAAKDKESSNNLLGSVLGSVTSASGGLLQAKWKADADKEAASITAAGNKETAAAYAEGRRGEIAEQGKWRLLERRVEFGADMNENQRRSYIRDTAVPAESRIEELENYRDESASYAARLGSINESNVKGISFQEARSLETRYGKPLFETATTEDGTATIVGLAQAPDGRPMISIFAEVEADRAKRYSEQFNAAVAAYNEKIAPVLDGMGREPRNFGNPSTLVGDRSLQDDIAAALGERQPDPEAAASSESQTPVTPLSLADRREEVNSLKAQIEAARKELDSKPANDPARQALEERVSSLETEFVQRSLDVNEAEQELVAQQIRNIQESNPTDERLSSLQAELKRLEGEATGLKTLTASVGTGVAAAAPATPAPTNPLLAATATTAPVTVTNINTNTQVASLGQNNRGATQFSQGAPGGMGPSAPSFDVHTQESLEAYKRALEERKANGEPVDYELESVNEKLASLNHAIDGFQNDTNLFLCEGSGPRDCVVDTNGLMTVFNEAVTAEEEVARLEESLKNDPDNASLREELDFQKSQLTDMKNAVEDYLENFNNESRYGHIYKTTAAHNSARLVAAIIQKMDAGELSSEDKALLKSGSFDQLVQQAGRFGITPMRANDVLASAASQFSNMGDFVNYAQYNPVAGYDGTLPSRDSRGGTGAGTPVCFRTGCEVQ